MKRARQEEVKVGQVDDEDEEKKLPNAQAKKKSTIERTKSAECGICCDRTVRVSFVPCGHAICLDCKPCLQKQLMIPPLLPALELA